MTADDVRDIALSLPESHEKETWGEMTFRVRDKIFVTVWEDVASVKASKEAQAALIGSDPDTFSVAHYTGRYGWTSVRLHRVNPEEMRELIVEAWRRTAPKRLVAAYDRRDQ